MINAKMYFIEFLTEINIIIPSFTNKLKLNTNIITSSICRNKFKEFTILQIIYTSDFILFEMVDEQLQSLLSIRIIDNNIWEISLIGTIPNNIGLGCKIMNVLIQVANLNNIHKIIANPYYNESKQLFDKFQFNSNCELCLTP